MVFLFKKVTVIRQLSIFQIVELMPTALFAEDKPTVASRFRLAVSQSCTRQLPTGPARLATSNNSERFSPLGYWIFFIGSFSAFHFCCS